MAGACDGFAEGVVGHVALVSGGEFSDAFIECCAFNAYPPPIADVGHALGGYGFGVGGEGGGSAGGDPLCTEVAVVMESSLSGGSKLVESNSEMESSEELGGEGTESSEELGGGRESRRGRPRERGVAAMYSNGRQR